MFDKLSFEILSKRWRASWLTDYEKEVANDWCDVSSETFFDWQYNRASQNDWQANDISSGLGDRDNLSRNSPSNDATILLYQFKQNQSRVTVWQHNFFLEVFLLACEGEHGCIILWCGEKSIH